MAKKPEPIRATVIIIGDSPRNGILLKFWLEGKGYWCFPVDSEEESMQKADGIKNLVGIFYASEFRFTFLNGKLEAFHIYEDSKRAKNIRLRETTLAG